jgi:hypothetical protein
MTFKILIKNILGVDFLQSSLERIINLDTNIRVLDFLHFCKPLQWFFSKSYECDEST